MSSLNLIRQKPIKLYHIKQLPCQHKHEKLTNEHVQQPVPQACGQYQFLLVRL